MLNLICLLLVAIVTKHVVHACQCQKRYFHQAYCQSDFVILARVVNSNTPPLQPHVMDIEVEVKRVFEKNEGNPLTQGAHAFIITPRAADMCSINLRQGVNYLLGGRVVRGALTVTSCELVQEWSQVSKTLRRALRKKQISCKCNVSGCNNEVCSTTRYFQRQKCARKLRSPAKKECYENYGVCTMRAGACTWTNSSARRVKTCLAESFPYKASLK